MADRQYDDTHRYLMDVFKKTNDPTLNEILKLLESSGRMPQFGIRSNMAARGEYNRLTDRLDIRPDSGSVGVVAHELTHAVDTRMANDYSDYNMHPIAPENISPTPERKQFYDAYDKLRPNTSKVPMTQNKDLYDNSFWRYRTDPDEMRAFGVGNMAKGDVMNPVNPHVDASMATDAAVLRDLYQRKLDAGNKQPRQEDWIDSLLKYIR